MLQNNTKIEIREDITLNYASKKTKLQGHGEQCSHHEDNEDHQQSQKQFWACHSMWALSVFVQDNPLNFHLQHIEGQVGGLY